MASEDGAFKSEENAQKARQKLQEAQVALKQSKEKNYYKILGIQRNAKEKASTMFQDISEAYEVLSDDEKRAKYDRGEEVFENQGGGGQRRNPFQFFNQNFHQGGGQRTHHRQGPGGGGQQRF